MEEGSPSESSTKPFLPPPAPVEEEPSASDSSFLEEQSSTTDLNKGFLSSPRPRPRPTTTTDPWLPISSSSSTGVSSSSAPSSSETAEDQCGFSVEQWLLQGVDSTQGGGGGGQEEKSVGEAGMSPPATTSGSGDHNNGGGGSSGGLKNQKGCACSHIVKGVSMPGLRKALKSDIKAICSKPGCVITAKPWMCLQCGYLGCGDSGAQGGHAKLHNGTPRSDCHSIAVQLQGNLDKAWCFDCQLELDPNSPFFKDSIPFLRRHPKIKSAIAQSNTPVAVSTPIVLGPPPPPPPPKSEPEKILKGKQNNRGASTSGTSFQYGRWKNRDSGGVDWPLGLDNLGNTCFMNSALQCLSRTRTLLDKLDLYGRGNLIEIAVSSEEPCVQIINPNVEINDTDAAQFSSEFSDREFLNDKHVVVGIESSQPCTSAEPSEGGSGEISPSSTEIDSLLDAASVRSSRKSESEGSGDSAEVLIWKKELRLELAKPLRLRLIIPNESITSKLRHCFKAITRNADLSPDSEETSYSRTVYCPRQIQLSVSKHFRLGQQHDSHELLRTVVDMMKKDQIKSFRLAIMQRYGVKRNEGKTCDPKLTELLKMWDRRLYHKTFVDEIFGGELVTFQECIQCKNVKRSHEEFLDLSLPIRVFRANANSTSTKKTYSLFDDDHDYVINRSVEECLRAYTEPEFLTGSNVVECENCHRLNLERLASGETFEQVFPGINLDSKTEANKFNSKNQQHPQRKQTKKRQNRQAKIRAKLNQPEFLQEISESQTKPSLDLIEDHFTNDQGKIPAKISVAPEDDSKSSKSGSLDDYVVVHNASTINQEAQSKSTRTTTTDVEMDYDTIDNGIPHLEAEELVDATEKQGSNLSRGLSSSIKSLSLIENGMDIEEGGGINDVPYEESMEHSDQNLDEYMDDLDDLAVDGICNASDIEDDEGSNPPPPRLDLGLEEKPISVEDYLTVPGTSGTADEGFSEGENSSEEKPLQSLSGSSSHNDISETDNVPTVGEKSAKKIPVTKCPCSRRQLISRAPECLTLHLKRFQHTARGSSKLSEKVTFPYILNLTEFCSEVGEDVNKPGFKSTFDEDGQVIYSLYGIVEHSGSLHFGHYVAYVKVAGKTAESGQQADDSWFYISDSHVSPTTLKQVLLNDAYILFYERIRGHEKKERLYLSQREVEVEPSAWSSNRSSYEKPATVSVATVSTWGDKWDDTSNQQVSSTNDTNEDMNMTLTYETENTNTEVGSVSSSTLDDVPLLSGIDGVSSTTDVDSMDYSAHMASASSSHPLWNAEEIQNGSSAFLSDIMSDEDQTQNSNNPVSSSSDVLSPQSDAGYLRLEES